MRKKIENRWKKAVGAMKIEKIELVQYAHCETEYESMKIILPAKFVKLA